MKYMLVWIIMTSTGVTSGAIEFENEDICIAARDVMQRAMNTRNFTSSYIWCFPKGIKQ